MVERRMRHDEGKHRPPGHPGRRPVRRERRPNGEHRTPTPTPTDLGRLRAGHDVDARQSGPTGVAAALRRLHAGQFSNTAVLFLFIYWFKFVLLSGSYPSIAA